MSELSLRHRKGTFEAATAFGLNLVLAMVIFIPYIISGQGVLTLIADYNKQQIPFNMISNEQIRSGEIFWNWSADLGTNFIGAYSFYTLGSPFFWLSMLFPPRLFPYLIGPLLMLKCAVAGLTAFLYIRRFTRLPLAALLGSMLYAWSGFQITNLQFNHFHDVTAFFPLLLLSLEWLVKDNRKGAFAFMTALMACINYFFFIGEVVFVFIYFLIRFSDAKRRPEGVSFTQLLFRVLGEGVLGVAMSAVLLLPSMLYVVQNPRSAYDVRDISHVIFVWKRYLMFVRAHLFPADPVGIQSVLYRTEFSSIGFYLPLFGSTLLWIYIKKVKSSWRRMLLLFGLMALFPLTNSLFYALNATYYARWFYMPGLIAAVVTVQVFERCVYIQKHGRSRADLKHRLNLLESKRRGHLIVRSGDFVVPAAITLGFSLGTLVWPAGAENNVVYQAGAWYLNIAVAVLGLLFTYLIIRQSAAVAEQVTQVNHRDSERAVRNRMIVQSIAIAFVLISVNTMSTMHRMHRSEEFDRPDSIRNLLYWAGLDIREHLPEDDVYRFYQERHNWNLSYVMNQSPVNTFISTISASTFDFYKSLDYNRYVFTRMPADDSFLSFLSVRFIIDEKEHEELELFYKYESESWPVYVYERPEADQLPFGFTMDRYIRLDDFKALEKEDRYRMLLEAVVLDEESAEAALSAGNPLLGELSGEEQVDRSDESYRIALGKRKDSVPESFAKTKDGFSAVYNLDSEAFAYFTVPYDSGWNAVVNGQPADIIEANGFMLLALPEGSATVHFEYRVPGLNGGIVISSLAVVTFVILLYLNRRRRIRHLAAETPKMQRSDANIREIV